MITASQPRRSIRRSQQRLDLWRDASSLGLTVLAAMVVAPLSIVPAQRAGLVLIILEGVAVVAMVLMACAVLARRYARATVAPPAPVRREGRLVDLELACVRHSLGAGAALTANARLFINIHPFVIASDDLVVMRLVVTATHKGDLLGIPATGRSVEWDAIDIYRVTDDGKISEEWAADDMATFASQLGAVVLPWAS